MASDPQSNSGGSLSFVAAAHHVHVLGPRVTGMPRNEDELGGVEMGDAALALRPGTVEFRWMGHEPTEDEPVFDADLSAVASSLVTLNLSYNSLVGVAGLEPLSCLTVLCLHGNDLVEIPSVVSALESLQRLGLSSNSIREVSPDLASLTNLEELCLEDNRLKRFSFRAAVALTRLTVLRLDGNAGLEFPAARNTWTLAATQAALAVDEALMDDL